MNLGKACDQFAGAPEQYIEWLQRKLDAPGCLRADRHHLEGEIRRTLGDVLKTRVGRVRFPVVGKKSERPDRLLWAEASYAERWRLVPVDEEKENVIRRWVLGAVSGIEKDEVDKISLYVSSREGWDSSSCDLALAVAVVSCLAEVEVRDSLVMTGCLGERGELRPPAYIDAKERLVEEWLPQGELYVPSPSGRLVDALDHALGPSWADGLANYLMSAESRMKEAWTAHRRFDYETAERIVDQLLRESALSEAILAQSHWVKGACRLHASEPEDGKVHLDKALDLLPHWANEDEREAYTSEELVAQYAVALIDGGLPEAAYGQLNNALCKLAPETQRSLRWQRVMLQVAGTMHRVLIAKGELRRAQGILEEWNLNHAKMRAELARNFASLAEVFRRQGEWAQAEQALAEAENELRHLRRGGERENQQTYLRLFGARLRADRGEPSEVSDDDCGPHYPNLAFKFLALRSGDEAGEKLIRMREQRCSAGKWPDIYDWIWCETMAAVQLAKPGGGVGTSSGCVCRIYKRLS